MSVTFLAVVLFILVVTVFILAFREPLAKLNLAATVPGASTSATASPQASPVAPPAASPNPARPSALVVDGGAKPSPSPSAAASPSASPSPSTSAPPAASPTAGPSAGASPAAKSTASPSPVAKPNAKPSPAASAKPAASSDAAKAGQGESLSVNLYFTRVLDDGRIKVEKVSRPVNYKESPLVTSIRALLRGPDGNELSQGLVSMIPAGTSLLSAWVQDSVANLNFSENFQFNPLGGDGLKAQLRQVVYVATEFPTVKAVQILIEGKKVAFLGGDNVPVGKPLTRQNLP